MNFDAFIGDIVRHHWPVFGVEVYEDGQLTHAWGDTVTNRYPIYSATKTITSIGVGLAVDDGRLDLHAPLAQYLPGSVIHHLSPAQQELYQQLTVRRLLTMSVAGYPFRPEGESWLRSVLELPLPRAAEPVFDYSNVCAYLAGVAATCALGEDLYAVLDRRVFRPLGIIDPPFERCPDGYFYGASKMALTVNELSRIGRLLAQGGTFDGQHILSAEYVQAATSVQQMNREGGYGYFVWKYRSGFSINGKWGQKCYVLPSEQKMITFLAHMEEGSNALRESMEQHLLGICPVQA